MLPILFIAIPLIVLGALINYCFGETQQKYVWLIIIVAFFVLSHYSNVRAERRLKQLQDKLHLKDLQQKQEELKRTRLIDREYSRLFTEDSKEDHIRFDNWQEKVGS